MSVFACKIALWTYLTSLTVEHTIGHKVDATRQDDKRVLLPPFPKLQCIMVPVSEFADVQRGRILHCHHIRVLEQTFDEGSLRSLAGALQDIKLVPPWTNFHNGSRKISHSGLCNRHKLIISAQGALGQTGTGPRKHEAAGTLGLPHYEAGVEYWQASWRPLLDTPSLVGASSGQSGTSPSTAISSELALNNFGLTPWFCTIRNELAYEAASTWHVASRAVSSVFLPKLLAECGRRAHS